MTKKSLRRASFWKGLIGILLILASQPLTAGCPCNYTPATLIQVIGADTLLLNVADVEETVQIAGIQTPRLEAQSESDEAWCKSEGEKAIQARDYATKLLLKASEISIDAARAPCLGKSLSSGLHRQYKSRSGVAL